MKYADDVLNVLQTCGVERFALLRGAAMVRVTQADGAFSLWQARSSLRLAVYRSARESIDRDIYLLRSTDTGRPFNGKLLHEWDINACPMSSMDFAENERQVFAAWETGGQIYWAGLANKTGGAAAPVAAPGKGKGRKHPRLSANGRGELLLAWTEGTGWQRGGSLAWQHYDASGQPTSISGKLPGVPVWSFAAPVAHPDGRFTILY